MRRRFSSANSKGGPAGQVRLIGGQWKRSLLPVCVDVPGLRPTPNRVRETLFNWLATVFDGRWDSLTALDLFAGTGALGFEAASRGMRQVLMVERHKAVFSCLKEAQNRFHAESLVTLVCGDAMQVAGRLVAEGADFDVIFLDPPFASDLLRQVLPFCSQLLRDGGVVYAESSHPLEESALMHLKGSNGRWDVIRQVQTGQVCYHLLQFRHPGNLQA